MSERNARPDPGGETSGRSPFAYRGVVEGFYGPVYSHADRLWLIDRLADWGMNTYVHAPKADAFGRDDWRTPYPHESLAEFRTLIAHGEKRGVRVGFTLSPGLSISYASQADRATLVEKFAAFTALGSRFLGLALDDVSSELEHPEDRERFASLGAAHADLASHVLASLPEDATLWFIPTDYAGCGSSPYLEDLATGLPAQVEVAWSGRTVVSPTLGGDEAKRRAAAVGRRLLVWDNVPVNDGPMRRALHLGPYTGRDGGLPEHLSGLLLNPMQHPRASAIGLQTAAAYMQDPADYDAEAAWHRALRDAAPDAPDAFALFAEAHRFSALLPDDRDRPLEAAFDAVRGAFAGSDGAARDAATRALAALAGARVDVADALEAHLSGTPLLAEIAPWVAAHHAESRRIVHACEFIATLAQDAPALECAIAFFKMQGRLGFLETPNAISYGPRRAIYPQLVSLANDEAHFGPDPVLFLDRNLAEAIVRFAEQLGLARLADGG